MEVHFIMAKLTRKQKVEIYHCRKNGETIMSLSKKFGVNSTGIKYLIRLIDIHGTNILRKDKNNYYSPELKEEIINKVLQDNQSTSVTSLEYGLSSSGILYNWIKSYKENGYVIVEKTKGRRSTVTKKTKPTKKYEVMTSEEKIKFLENRNLYLEAENEYIKKLDAVVQLRKNRLPKKK